MSNSSDFTPVILAGGKGTRLWPMSRSARPKQFLALTGEWSLFQATLLRLRETGDYADPLVVTNEEYRFLVAEQAAECGVALGAILLEPVARNTAPAVAAASAFAENRNPGTLVHILPSDHEVGVDDAYRQAVATAVTAAEAGQLVTFGITPTEPATGYGYIEAGQEQESGALTVSRFVEKPDAGIAQKMIAAGNYYWNSGMFLFKAETFLAECERLAQEVHEAAISSVNNAAADLDFIRLDMEAFSQAPNISIDYAIFEKTDKAAVVRSPIVWSDLGAWDAVHKAGGPDDQGNVARGPVSLIGTSGSLVISEKLHIAVNGLEDVAVIATEDAVLVGKLSKAQGVGDIVKALKSDPETLALTEIHRTSYRPWGGYTSLITGERFQVKRLFVKPGKELSLQKHHHRSEHWVVVRGTAEVTIGDTIKTIGENESVYIPRGEVHRLANPGKIELELIEVQTGAYLGEDDIIRLEDKFGRV